MLKLLKYTVILCGMCIASGAVAEPLPPAGVPALPRWTILPRTDQSIPLSTTVFSADHPLWTFDLTKAGYVEEGYLIEGKGNPAPGIRVCGMLTHIEAMPERDLKLLYPTPDVMKATAERQIEYLVKQRYLLPEDAALDLEKIRSTFLEHPRAD